MAKYKLRLQNDVLFIRTEDIGLVVYSSATGISTITSPIFLLEIANILESNKVISLDETPRVYEVIQLINKKARILMPPILETRL